MLWSASLWLWNYPLTEQNLNADESTGKDLKGASVLESELEMVSWGSMVIVFQQIQFFISTTTNNPILIYEDVAVPKYANSKLLLQRKSMYFFSLLALCYYQGEESLKIVFKNLLFLKWFGKNQSFADFWLCTVQSGNS